MENEWKNLRFHLTEEMNNDDWTFSNWTNDERE